MVRMRSAVQVRQAALDGPSLSRGSALIPTDDGLAVLRRKLLFHGTWSWLAIAGTMNGEINFGGM